MSNPLKPFYCLTSTQPHCQHKSDIIATLWPRSLVYTTCGSCRWDLLDFICSWLWLCNCTNFFGFRWLQVRPLPPPVRTTCVSCCFWCSPSAGLQFGEDVPGDPSTFVWTIITYDAKLKFQALLWDFDLLFHFLIEKCLAINYKLKRPDRWRSPLAFCTPWSSGSLFFSSSHSG